MDNTLSRASGATSALSGRTTTGHARAPEPRPAAIAAAVVHSGQDLLVKVDVAVGGVVVTALVREHYIVTLFRKDAMVAEFSTQAVRVEVTRVAIEAARSTTRG